MNRIKFNTLVPKIASVDQGKRDVTSTEKLKVRTYSPKYIVCLELLLQSFRSNGGLRANVMRMGNSYLDSVD